LTRGPRVAQFEQEFRDYVGARYALAANSGTAALHLSLCALNIGPGDEVITTPLTFCATVNMIVRVGAIPVLADIGADGNIDPELVAARVTERTRAVMPVHMAGLPCEMNALWKLARTHGLRVIEDSAHAAGSKYRGRPIGAGDRSTGDCSDAVAFSFHPTKNLTTGEGGMVTAPDEEVADTMRLLCLHGISKDAWNRYADRGNWYYDVLMSGFKYNLTDIQASIGIHQLRKLEQFIERRAALAGRYRELLGDVEELELPPEKADCRHAWHLYILRLNLDKLEIDRGEMIRELKARGVGSSVHFIPITLHPFFARFAAGNECPKAEALYQRIISMPLFPAMSDEQLTFAASAIKQVVRANRKGRPVALGADSGSGAESTRVPSPGIPSAQIM